MEKVALGMQGVFACSGGHLWPGQEMGLELGEARFGGLTGFWSKGEP